VPSAKTKGGIWITDPHDRDREPQRVVVIEYQDGWPCSVVTELHWDHSRKPWFKPGREAKTVVENSGMMLIARSLEFRHPLMKKKLSFSLDLPDRYVELKRALGD
jgi:hypothetical protein